MKNHELKNTRESVGLTQVQVAEKAQITEISYQRIEYGTQLPSLRTAQLIARSLGTTVEKLFPLPERQLREKKQKARRQSGMSTPK